jgi:hypothetical protein
VGILGDSSAPEPVAPARSELAPPARQDTAAPVSPSAERSSLQRRRDALAAEVTELHWDLGGLAYEMAIRDHFRLDVLVRRAAILQQRDAELAEVERMLRMEEQGVAGTCANCSAPHSRGAVYCWQCGSALMAARASETVAAEGAHTVDMDALLAAPDRGHDAGE